MVEFVEHLQEVTDGASDAIESPHQHDVELASPGIAQQLLQAGAFRLGATETVGVLVNDLEAALRGQAAQIMKLGFRMLLEGGDTKIQRRSFHGRRSFFFGATPYLATYFAMNCRRTSVMFSLLASRFFP